MEKEALPPPPNKRLIKTALHQAILDIRLHQVRLLVSRHGVDIDSKDMHGRTPLMVACMIDNEEHGFKMASILLKARATLNVRDTMGRSALHYACLNGRFEIVRSILREDVLDINDPDNDGNTPLHHAAMSGNPQIVHHLSETFARFGLNPDKRNKLGYTPLLLACRSGHFVSAHSLLTITHASPQLRDGEFHLNATEWIQRSQRLLMSGVGKQMLSSAPLSKPAPHSLSFSREYTMYRLPSTSRYFSYDRPSRSQQSPRRSSLGNSRSFSLDSARSAHVHFPPVFQTQAPSQAQSRQGVADHSEVFFEGRDARQVMIEEISDIESKQRPVSVKTPVSRFNHPPTAKLLSIGRRTYKGVPHDVIQIFRVYSDQYRPPPKAPGDASSSSSSSEGCFDESISSMSVKMAA